MSHHHLIVYIFNLIVNQIAITSSVRNNLNVCSFFFFFLSIDIDIGFRFLIEHLHFHPHHSIILSLSVLIFWIQMSSILSISKKTLSCQSKCSHYYMSENNSSYLLLLLRCQYPLSVVFMGPLLYQFPYWILICLCQVCCSLEGSCSNSLSSKNNGMRLYLYSICFHLRLHDHNKKPEWHWQGYW